MKKGIAHVEACLRFSLFKIPLLICLPFLLESFSFVPPRPPRSLYTIGGGYFFAGPHHSGGGIELEYRPAKFFFRYIRPQISLISPEFKGVFLGAGVGIDCYLSQHWVFTPSFEPGLYYQGESRNLGCPIEFRSCVEMTYETCRGNRFGLQFFHLSNARLGNHNPGENSLMFILCLRR